MERDYYFLFFPDGDQQPIDHALRFGDIVDMNGNLYTKETLNPKHLAYEVVAIKRKTHFKETQHFYKLRQLHANEVKGEIEYNNSFFENSHLKEKLKDVFSKLEKKYTKKKRR